MEAMISDPKARFLNDNSFQCVLQFWTAAGMTATKSTVLSITELCSGIMALAGIIKDATRCQNTAPPIFPQDQPWEKRFRTEILKGHFYSFSNVHLVWILCLWMMIMLKVTQGSLTCILAGLETYRTHTGHFREASRNDEFSASVPVVSWRVLCETNW